MAWVPTSTTAALENIGDVDLDGTEDFAVGLAWGGTNNSGQLDVYSGATCTILWSIVPAESSTFLGTSLAKVDDLDGDGAPEVLVGAGWNGGGYAELRSGANGTLIRSFSEPSPVRYGWNLEQVGDLDGDGIGELAIADVGKQGGIVYFYSPLSNLTLLEWNPVGLGDFGAAILTLDDLDGDGFEDLAIGLSAKNRVRVISARTPIGAPYCGPANANSTGQPAVLSAHGSVEVQDNDLVLRSAQLPPGQPNLWLVSDAQGFVGGVGGGQGDLCLGGTIARFANQVEIAPGSGLVVQAINLTNLPFSPSHAVQPGETWNFQAWYRDQNPAATSNLTDAVSVTFE